MRAAAAAASARRPVGIRREAWLFKRHRRGQDVSADPECEPIDQNRRASGQFFTVLSLWFAFVCGLSFFRFLLFLVNSFVLYFFLIFFILISIFLLLSSSFRKRNCRSFIVIITYCGVTNEREALNFPAKKWRRSCRNLRLLLSWTFYDLQSLPDRWISSWAVIWLWLDKNKEAKW